jgi:hypothetical protein
MTTTKATQKRHATDKGQQESEVLSKGCLSKKGRIDENMATDMGYNKKKK